MNNYEVMFVIDPTLDDEKKEAAVERVKEVISSEGEVVNVDVWGLRKLAYPINYETEAYYIVAQFASAPEFPAELDRILNITDGVLRSMITVTE